MISHIQQHPWQETGLLVQYNLICAHSSHCRTTIKAKLWITGEDVIYVHITSPPSLTLISQIRPTSIHLMDLVQTSHFITIIMLIGNEHYSCLKNGLEQLVFCYGSCLKMSMICFCQATSDFPYFKSPSSSQKESFKAHLKIIFGKFWATTLPPGFYA